MIPSWQIYGHKAHLVLEDEGGLFEVKTPTCFVDGQMVIDVERVLDAIEARKQAAGKSMWPVY